jgi:hypothetical protein
VSTITWPFDGRILHALGGEPLEPPWLCLRGQSNDDGEGWQCQDGVGILLRRIGLHDPLPAGVGAAVRAAFGLSEPPPIGMEAPIWAAAGLPKPLPELDPPARILGIGMPPQLAERAGRLLSDHFLMRDASLRDELRTTPNNVVWLRPEWLTHMYRLLHSQLRRGEIAPLSGLRWPPTIEPMEVRITAEALARWQFDPATDFCRLIASETCLYDLRVPDAQAPAHLVSLVSPAAEPNARAAPPPELPSPTEPNEVALPAAKRPGTVGHPANAWIYIRINQQLERSEAVSADTKTAGDLIAAWNDDKEAQAKRPAGQRPPEPRAVVEVIRRALSAHARRQRHD